jgi:hypothetical protein
MTVSYRRYFLCSSILCEKIRYLILLQSVLATKSTFQPRWKTRTALPALLNEYSWLVAQFNTSINLTLLTESDLLFSFLIFLDRYSWCCRPGGSVGIATGYGLDSSGIESQWGRDFPHLSRPALGPNQPPVQWVSGLSRGKERPERDAYPSPAPSAMVKK